MMGKRRIQPPSPLRKAQGYGGPRKTEDRRQEEKGRNIMEFWNVGILEEWMGKKRTPVE